MRSADDSELRHADGDWDESAVGDADGSRNIDVLAAMIRYKWAVIVPAMLGLLVGGVAWTQLPETYESAARLLGESDNPIILDASTGEVATGVPGADVIQAQLFSDDVLSSAAREIENNNPSVATVIEDEFGGSFGNFAMRCVTFESESDPGNKSHSLAFRLAVRHTSEDLVNAASQALNNSLIKYFDDKRVDSIEKLRVFIAQATSEYGPRLAALEEKHRNFQKSNALEFDEEGNAINPHRLNIVELKNQRALLERDFNEMASNLNIVENVLKETPDTRTAIDIVGQYLDKELATPSETRRKLGVADEDFDMKRLGFETQLVPLMVARQQAAALYGENHPSVVNLDSQIKYSKEEFEKLSRELTNRLKTLMNDSEKELEEARAAAVTIVTAMRAQKAALATRLENLDKAIAAEKEEAEKLASAEQTNASLVREIMQANGLLSTLKEQMARVDLADKQAGIMLTQLNQPSRARVVGPNLLLLLAGGLGVGLLMGCGLAYLLESQAGTFRTADEIASYLHVAILSHVPFDPGRRGRLKKGDDDPYRNLDDKLSVLHRPASMAAEAVRACRTAVFFESTQQGAKVIQVTSPLPSDGKTTLAGNLAVSIAQSGKRVILVDCDLRRPQLSDNFSLGEVDGLTNVLNGDCDPVSATHLTPVKNLSVMPSGPIPLNPAEALTLPEMSELIEWLRDRYDYVIVDTPPLLVVTDPSIVAGMVDGVVLTLKVRRKSKANSREAVSILRGVGANILGVVINASDDTAGSDGYRGYGYYKYSRYASKYNADSGYGSARRSGSAGKKSSRPSMLIGGREGKGRLADLNGSKEPRGPKNGSVGLLAPDDDDNEV
jgi:capsular exopolysaccharide synthesis family protein